MKILIPPIIIILLFANSAMAAPKAKDIPVMTQHYVDNFFKMPPGYSLGESPGVAMDSKGNLYIFNRGAKPLLEFNPDGNFLKEWHISDVIKAHGLYIDRDDNIWLVDVLGHTVREFNQQGQLLLTLGTSGVSGADESHFNQPTDVVVDHQGSIYVSDGYVNSRIIKFTHDGEFVIAWGTKGKKPGQFNLPHAITTDSSGRVYVADRGNKRVQVFTSDGQFISEWKNVGTPYGFFMSPDDVLYVTDGDGNRLLKMDLEGNILATLGSPGANPGQLKLPHDVCVKPDGEIFISEITNHRVQKFALD